MSRPSKAAKLTPMLQHYLEVKEQYPGTILFYRLGDFYEMFFEDAELASRVLGLTLTSRSSKNDPVRVPMCGVPHHAAASYLAKLVNAGYRVAVCEQVEDPKTAKGMVQREVVKVVTPGLVTEDQVLDDKSNRYVAAAQRFRERWGLAFLDLSTGEFLVTECASDDEAADELHRMQPSELVYAEGEDEQRIGRLLGPSGQDLCRTPRPDSEFDLELARATLCEHFQTASLAGFGCDDLTAAVAAAGGLLRYIIETQKRALGHIERLARLDRGAYLLIDDASRRNLEITQTIVGGQRQGSLLSCLDQTCTPMGARFLKRALLFPLREVTAINLRLDTVAALTADAGLREDLRHLLAGVYDLERLNSRVVLGSANARDLTALRVSLGRLPPIKDLLVSTSGLLADLANGLDPLADIHDLLARAIHEEAPVGLRDGGLIRPGYSAELDELLHLLRDGKDLIAGLEAKEREKSGIANLKIGYNKVFGYYFEVSKAQQAKVPDYFIRKQTLVNAERYITPELKEFEQKVLGAEEKRLALEYELFCEIRRTVAAASSRILAAASVIAQLDFFACLAEVAETHRYVRPEVTEGDEIMIEEGRHPVIERSLPPGRFVPNDIRLDQERQEVLIITGPNMAGKSTVLRQTALIVLMAQAGCFVPAKKAVIGVVDRIFTRVGAMDDLRRAQSTFMVEMHETANICNNATPRSLVILDEIGRGTSTYDGLAIAWAVAEELADRDGKGVKTLFATHYHELTDLANCHPRITNYNIAVREWNDQIIFLHKLVPGATNRSYGIQVAALAGVPPRVVKRAQELLANIEAGEFDRYGAPRIAGRRAEPEAHHPRPSQLTLFEAREHPVVERLRTIEPDRLTPLEALTLLYELKGLAAR